MANIYEYEPECTANEQGATVRSALAEMLRPCDEAILLPGASQSTESFGFKNVVFSLDGSTNGPPFRIFSHDWGHGVSVARVPNQAVQRILRTKNRMELLNSLSASCRNALTLGDGNEGAEVGPQMGKDLIHDDPDDVWHAGFDGSNCCVGLYYATEYVAPTGGNVGMTRAVPSYFLVAKAGAGVAASQFSTKLILHLLPLHR